VKGRKSRDMKGRPKPGDSTFSTSMTTSPVDISLCLILRGDERSNTSVSMLINTPFSSLKAWLRATSQARRPYMPPIPRTGSHERKLSLFIHDRRSRWLSVVFQVSELFRSPSANWRRSDEVVNQDDRRGRDDQYRQKSIMSRTVL